MGKSSVSQHSRKMFSSSHCQRLYEFALKKTNCNFYNKHLGYFVPLLCCPKECIGCTQFHSTSMANSFCVLLFDNWLWCQGYNLLCREHSIISPSVNIHTQYGHFWALSGFHSIIYLIIFFDIYISPVPSIILSTHFWEVAEQLIYLRYQLISLVLSMWLLYLYGCSSFSSLF